MISNQGEKILKDASTKCHGGVRERDGDRDRDRYKEGDGDEDNSNNGNDRDTHLPGRDNKHMNM